jgi:hypothetical protein
MNDPEIFDSRVQEGQPDNLKPYLGQICKGAWLGYQGRLLVWLDDNHLLRFERVPDVHVQPDLVAAITVVAGLCQVPFPEAQALLAGISEPIDVVGHRFTGIDGQYITFDTRAIELGEDGVSLAVRAHRGSDRAHGAPYTEENARFIKETWATEVRKIYGIPCEIQEVVHHDEEKPQ